MEFLRNHADGIVAIDLFVVPTISFRLLYGLLIIHGRRQILWFGVDKDQDAASYEAQTEPSGSGAPTDTGQAAASKRKTAEFGLMRACGNLLVPPLSRQPQLDLVGLLPEAEKALETARGELERLRKETFDAAKALLITDARSVTAEYSDRIADLVVRSIRRNQSRVAWRSWPPCDRGSAVQASAQRRDRDAPSRCVERQR